MKIITLLLLALLITPTITANQDCATQADLLTTKNEIIMEMTDVRNEVNQKYTTIDDTIERYKIELEFLARNEIKAQVDRIIISLIAIFFLAISIFLAFISYITIRKYEVLADNNKVTGDELNETPETRTGKKPLIRKNKN